MPSFLALILCIAFVFLLLRLEHKQAPNLSPALWIPTIWLLYTMSRQLSGWFKQEMTIEMGSPVDRAFLTVLLCINVIVLLKRRFGWSVVFRNNPWLMVLFGYMLFSVLWSSMPFISFKRWTRELVALTTAFLLSSEQHPRIALMSLLRRNIYILLPFSLILIKYYPALGRRYNPWDGEVMWTGVTDQKNQLAKLCIISIFFVVWVLRQRWKGYDVPATKYQIYIELFLLFLSFWLLGGPQRRLTYSATSIIVLMVGIIAFAVLLWANKKGVILRSTTLSFVFGLIMIYGTVTPFLGKLSIFDVSTIVGRDPTLTTRTTRIWAPLVPFAISRPLIGHGVGGFWTTSMRELTSTSAHNGYLGVILDYGFIGLGLVLLFILSCARKAVKSMASDLDWGIFFICFILMLLVHNIAESSIQTFTYTLTAITLFLSVTSSKDIQKKRLSHETIKGLKPE